MKRNDLLLRLICILCVTVLVCGVFSGCQQPPEDLQATEEPTGNSASDPSGDPNEDPSGDPNEDPSGDPNEDPSGDPNEDPVDDDSLIMDREDNIEIPFD